MKRIVGIDRWRQQNRLLLSAAFLLGSVALMNGCTVIQGIFKAGVWVGVLSVVGVIGLLIWGASALLR
jgi:ABC-type enterochelin transport system permease subunit